MRITFDPSKFKALATDLSHDELIAAIQVLHPEAVHGRDFVVGHPVKAGSTERTGPAQLIAWNLPQDPPDVDTDIGPVWQEHSEKIRTALVARDVRSQRNAALQQADVIVNKAHDSNDPQALAKAVTYRKALRDLPDQPGFPHTHTWPTKP
jgi:hypothetical protein